MTCDFAFAAVFETPYAEHCAYVPSPADSIDCGRFYTHFNRLIALDDADKLQRIDIERYGRSNGRAESSSNSSVVAVHVPPDPAAFDIGGVYMAVAQQRSGERRAVIVREMSRTATTDYCVRRLKVGRPMDVR